ncbi:hypothetical protein AAFX70_00025 (plasmid) [Salmonella enterica subsp. enterica serovar Typhimurium]|uniref:hypothetical protein n=1 Tax=Salmonella enterica TaxID=28901 RepID=UPI000A8F6549
MNGEQHTDSLLKICETIEKRLKIFCILIASQALMIEGKKSPLSNQFDAHIIE